MPRTNKSFSERFWDKVNKDTDSECWEWTATTDGCDYGDIKLNGSTEKAHRAALALEKGDLSLVDEFDKVLHSCDNPSCVNPEHLRSGTQKDNMLDMSERQRASNQQLDSSDAREIKQRYREEDVTQYDLADDFGVKQGSIAAIINGHSFKHVD